ncbi:DUF3168 domain-containing protein [Palleronia caenipelagi]|uniref:DUF3168 domain-containing protein n=1 Tax=Palleronia caenipelagi TaxID=2489174 RepID=A0A547Q696_9RHOB|nr:DUF3168 domain-containing protein [Palleronia caenipelagi]TRD21908.1 DUF3168 domain-containing protein [Palleronia caenipelagi]
MIAPDVALQTAIESAVTADAELMTQIAWIYDEVPDDPYAGKTAYLSFGPSDLRDQSAECVQTEVHNLQIDVWSKAVGRIEAKGLTRRVIDLIRGGSLIMPAHRLGETVLALHRIISDPDPGVTHGVVQFDFHIEVEEG